MAKLVDRAGWESPKTAFLAGAPRDLNRQDAKFAKKKSFGNLNHQGAKFAKRRSSILSHVGVFGGLAVSENIGINSRQLMRGCCRLRRMNRQDAKGAKGLKVAELSAELDDLAHHVIGAAIEVHRLLGPGFLESVYEEALCVELALRDIRCARQVPISVSYKGERVGESRLDLLVDDRLVVELKAVESIAPMHLAQVLSYLKAGRRTLGLLINFNVSVLKNGIKRVVQTQ